MVRINVTFAFLLMWFSIATAQPGPRNLVLVTLDGFRWQDVFAGADSSLLFNEIFTNDSSVIQNFWAPDKIDRREKLLPFIWSTIGTQGQLFGNRSLGNKLNCSNPYLFSYPGYSEMLVGYVDRKMRSNHKIENPNTTVLEFIASESAYKNKVAVFSTWDVIPYIVGAKRASIPYSTGRECELDTLTDQHQLRRELQEIFQNPYGDRFDLFTFYEGFEYLREMRPHVLMISLDETDEHSHGGRYDEYLKSAHQADAMIAELWEWLQQDEQYRNNTTLLITTDHNRGHLFKGSWKHHGIHHLGSSHIWMAIIGPDIPARGEIGDTETYFQKQLAQTISSLLGLSFSTKPSVAEGIDVTNPWRYSRR